MIYLGLITPTNIADEKKKFFASATYSPQFVYDWNPEDLTWWLQQKPVLKNLVKALLAQNVPEIQSEAAKLQSVNFRPADLMLAKKIISCVPQGTSGGAKDVAAAIRRRLEDLNIDYSVEIVDEHGFQCRPKHEERLVRVSKYISLQFHTPEGLANHEVTHVIRAVNGEYNGIQKSNDYLPTEEGLCSFLQDGGAFVGSPSLFQHALEYLGAYQSQKCGFRELYDFLVERGFSPETAWARGIRQKFGICDTSRPGGILRPAIYFYYSQLVGELSKDELLRLFVGKIPLSRLSDYPDYSGIIPKSRLEEFVNSCLQLSASRV